MCYDPKLIAPFKQVKRTDIIKETKQKSEQTKRIIITGACR